MPTCERIFHGVSSSNVLGQRLRQGVAAESAVAGFVQPVDLVSSAHHDELVAVAADRSVVVEAPGSA